MVANLDLENLTSSMQAMDDRFNKAEFNEKAKFGLLRNFSMKVKERSVFKIYRSLNTDEKLKGVIRD